MKLPGWFWRVIAWLQKAHDAGLLEQKPGPFVDARPLPRDETIAGQIEAAKRMGASPKVIKIMEDVRVEAARRRKTGLLFILAAGSLSLAASCPNIPDIDRDCRVLPCSNGQVCTKPTDGSFTWICRTPDPDPTPTPCPSAPPGCTQLGPCKWVCASPTPLPTATPTPLPTPSPSASPTPLPTPSPTPSPCNPSPQKVCVKGDGTVFPFDRTQCWTCADWQGYMTRNGYFTAGDPKEDGDVAGHPGYWLNYDPQGVLVGFISKKDCKNKQGVLVVDYPRAEERVVPCPTPTPTPGPTPSPSVPPSPLPGVACTPLSHVGVAFHAQHPAPNGPLGYRWVFSATPKSRKPFCPDKRNECEQQAYQGDPVNDYDRVTWRFDLRFQCQDPAGPLWNQQEPHTGDSWENTDVRQENAYMANLKPAVKGLHRVRTCRRDAPTVCEITEKVAN